MANEFQPKGRGPDLAMGDPRLYLYFGEPHGCSRHFGPWSARPDEKAQKVSVIAPATGGECRGYWLMRGALWHFGAGPNEPREWPEVDAEVARVTGFVVHGPGVRP